MPMPPYSILCYTQGCQNLAQYKIAARWSDGVQNELKTYALSCEPCLPDWFRQSRKKQHACRLTPGESLDEPGIYHIQRGLRDRQLSRLEDVERKLVSGE